MAATFRFEIDTKPTRNKTFAIYLCVSIHSKRKRSKTPFEVKRIDDFNPKCKGDNWIRTRVPEAKVWNDQMRNLLNRSRNEYLNLENGDLVTSEMVVDELHKENKAISFFLFAKNRSQEILDNGGFRNWKKYNNFLNKFKKFMNILQKKDLYVQEITPELLSKFDHFLHTLHNERQPDKLLHPNTIQVELNIFRSIVKRAIAIGVMKPSKDPFISMKFKGVKTEKEKLNEDEMDLVIGLELKEGSTIWHSRNCFLFSYYCAGIRAGDLVQLRWLNITSDGRLNYQMGKNHKIRDLVLIDQAKEILSFYEKTKHEQNDYIFPFMDPTKPYANAVTQADKDTLPIEIKKSLLNEVSTKNAELNKYLAKIAKMAGIDKKI